MCNPGIYEHKDMLTFVRLCMFVFKQETDGKKGLNQNLAKDLEKYIYSYNNHIIFLNYPQF